MRAVVGPLAAAVLVLVAYGATVQHGPALADEFIYMAGARHFASTGSLDARYYDAAAILRQGHPHHDVHTPGYVLLLGAVNRMFPSGYTTAVALNVVCYLLAVWLVYSLGIALGADDPTAALGALLMALLPGAAAYVFWVMAESVLTVLVLAAATVAARNGRAASAAISGAVLGAALLVRESAVFALPAVIALLRGRLRAWCGVAFLLVAVFVYAPLSRHRAPGGANFWAPTGGRAFGYEAVAAGRKGRISEALAAVAARAASNARELVAPGTTWTERGILASYLAVALLTAAGLRQRRDRTRRYAIAVLAGFAAVVALLFGVYVLVQWSGFRYRHVPDPRFSCRWPSCRRVQGRLAAAFLAAAGVVLLFPTQQIVDAYKVSRQRRQAGIADYVDRYVKDDPGRVVLGNGWLYGWRHAPTEVISSLPDRPGILRSLEQKIWFDFLVLPPEAAMRQEVESRRRYAAVNGDDPDPPLLIYRRVLARREQLPPSLIRRPRA